MYLEGENTKELTMQQLLEMTQDQIESGLNVKNPAHQITIINALSLARFIL